MKKNILSVFAFISLSMTAQEAVKLTAGKLNDFGLVYNLPTTLAEVKVHITKTENTAGPYYKYAQKYLGVQDVIAEDATIYNIDGIEIVEKGVADPEYSYLIKFRTGSTPSIYLSSEGNLVSVNVEPESKAKSTSKNKNKADKEKTERRPSYSVLNEEQLSAGSTAKMAESAAKQIYRLRESRINIATGDVDHLPADAESYKLIMQQHDDQEGALTEMFLGNVDKESYVETLTFDPATSVGKEVLFRFSSKLGLLDKENLAGEPYIVNVEILEDLRPEDNPQAKKAKEKNKEKGLAYVLPGKVAISLINNNKKVSNVILQISQLGDIKQLPATIFDDKKAPAKATFNPNTGALINLTE